MSGLNNNDFDRTLFNAEIYDIVRQIPAGWVLTYGQIARLAGFPQYARLVGKTLALLPFSLELPCQRVVNSQGRIAPHWPEQRILLEEEGVTFKANGCVNLKRHAWSLTIAL